MTEQIQLTGFDQWL